MNFRQKCLYNRNVLKETLEENGYDSAYLLEWGIPDFWQESFWGYAEYVLKLVEYFEKTYKVYDTRDSIDIIDDNS